MSLRHGWQDPAYDKHRVSGSCNTKHDEAMQRTVVGRAHVVACGDAKCAGGGVCIEYVPIGMLIETSIDAPQ